MGKLRIYLVFIVVNIYAGIAVAASVKFMYEPELQIMAIISAAYVAICIVGHYLIYRIAQSRHASSDPKFNKTMPFSSYGATLVNFQHLYRHDTVILDGLVERINRELVEYAGMDNLKTVVFTDIDKKLSVQDTRTFHLSTSKDNVRKSALTFVLHVGARHRMQSIEWWILHRGFFDSNALFLMLACAPLTFLLRIIPFIRREYDPVSSLHSVYNSFYNDIDVITDARCIQEVAFESLVKYLDEHGVDTSDLKHQRAAVMNISVNGGKASFGTVMQGMKNMIKPAHAEG